MGGALFESDFPESDPCARVRLWKESGFHSRGRFDSVRNANARHLQSAMCANGFRSSRRKRSRPRRAHCARELFRWHQSGGAVLSATRRTLKNSTIDGSEKRPYFRAFSRFSLAFEGECSYSPTRHPGTPGPTANKIRGGKVNSMANPMS